MAVESPRVWVRLSGYAVAVAGPAVLTAGLEAVGGTQPQDYVFLYLGLVAVLGVASGLGPALVAAASSLILVDYYFVPPLHTLTIADPAHLVNLVVFFGAAGVVGGLGSLRRRAQLRAEGLAAKLRGANVELERLNQEQAAAAAVAVRLAQTQQHVRLLEETDRLRRELLANVSHELRTPLGTILTGTTALAERADLPNGVRPDLEAVVEETRRLGRLVADMLDMTRIEGDALDLRLEERDLGEAIEAAAQRLALISPGRAVEVEMPEGGIEVIVDWDRLGQVFDNLLANADRYAPVTTPITVRASPGKRAMAVIRVVDQGPGVEPGLRDRVFDRFVRDGGGDGIRGGMGLGLAIVRGLVEAQAGRIWLEEASAGEGAHFAFSLPLAAPDQGAGPAAARGPEADAEAMGAVLPGKRPPPPGA